MAEVDAKKPRMLIEEDRELFVEIDLDSIAEYFTCSLCIGLFREPHTIPECLHTFCKSCIVKQLRTKPECPTCQCQTAVHAIKLDRNIDALFQKLFPEVQKKDEETEKQWYKDNNLTMPEKPPAGSASNPLALPPTKAGLKRMASTGSASAPSGTTATTANESKKAASASTTTAGSSGGAGGGATSSSSSSAATPRQPPVKIKLTLQSEDPKHQLEKPYIEAGGPVKVEVFRKHIAQTFGVALDKVLLFCNGEPLAPDHTAEFIQRTKWRDPGVNMVWTFRVITADSATTT